jgi:hypothetical protein
MRRNILKIISINKLLSIINLELHRKPKNRYQPSNNSNFLEKDYTIKELFKGKKELTSKSLAVCYLITSDDQLPLLELSIKSLLISISRIQISVYTTDHSSQLYDYCKNLNLDLYLIESKNLDLSVFKNYQDFDTKGFNFVTNLKWVLLTHQLGLHNKVLYIDIDIVVLKDFSGHIIDYLDYTDILMQTEALDSVPNTFCTGFMALNKNSIPLLNMLLSTEEKQKHQSSDQTLFNIIAKKNFRTNEFNIYPLSEYLYVNGRFWKIIDSIEANQFQPLIFHSNFCIGLDEKLNRMQKVFDKYLKEQE